MTTRNNLKQLGLAVHTHHDLGDQEPEHGFQKVQPNGVLVALLLPAVQA